MIMTGSASFALDKVTDWIPKLADNLRVFKPEIKNVNINYLDRNVELGMAINVSGNIRRKFRYIELPTFQNCKITSIMDCYFNDIKINEVAQFDKNKIKIKTSMLPKSEDFYMRISGELPKNTLDNIVFVQPAMNKDRKDGDERYWLNSMIRNVESLENLWNNLEVDDVKAGVNIGIERHLSTNLPPELKKGLEAMQKYSRSIYSKHWSEVRDTWLNLKKLKNSKMTVNDLTTILEKVTNTDYFSEFVEIDSPYNLGKIKNKEPNKAIPQNMYAEALTKLTLKKPVAEGHMTFKKEKYVDSIKREYDEM